MDPRDFAIVKRLLLKMLEIPPGEREQVWARLPAGERALRAEVEELLTAHDREESQLEGRVLSAMAEVDTPERLVAGPSHIGPYEILAEIGRGGMGVVYRALQREPIEREVALKLIRHGLAHEGTVARFEWERRTLASMDHPDIASVYDAGADEYGQPWVAMELVRGEPIDVWAGQAEPDLNERITLIIRVGRAVQHAHERGILHRDLKPGNVLVREVGGKARPVVIDFGIAKALDAERTQGIELTLDHQRLGTPAYMSPELLRGESALIDTRSDVYALGVILYRLLTGHHPFEDEEGGLEEIGRSRTTRAITPPSSVSLDAEATPTIQRMQRHLRGDLDTICLKALHPDPERRYPTVAHLVEDLERVRDHRPILARPDSWTYRLSKLRRRRPVAVALAAAALVFLTSTVGFLLWHGKKMQTERDRANAEAESAQQLASFLEGLFTEIDPTVGGAADLTGRELLDQGARRIRADLESQPVARARMIRAIGAVYHAFAMHDSAAPLLAEGLELLADEEGLEPARVRADLGMVLGSVYHDQGRYAESEQIYRQAVEEYRTVHGGPSIDGALAQSYTATSVQAQDRVEEAAALFETAVEEGTAIAGPDHADVIWSRSMVGYMRFKLGHYQEARRVFEECARSQRRTLGGDHIDLAHTLNNLGGIYHYLGRLEEAETAWSEALDMYRRVYAIEHPAVARGLTHLARLHAEMGRIDEARSLARDACAMADSILGPAHNITTQAQLAWATVLRHEGRLVEAEHTLLRVIAVRDSVLGAEHPRALDAVRDLAELRLVQERGGDAVDLLARVLAHHEGRLDDRHPLLNEIRLQCAEAALLTGDREEARRYADQARAGLEATYPAGHRWRKRLDEVERRVR